MKPKKLIIIDESNSTNTAVIAKEKLVDITPCVIPGVLADGADRDHCFTLEGSKNTHYMIQIQSSGPLEEKALYLSPYYDWEFVDDGSGCVCLVPLKR